MMQGEWRGQESSACESKRPQCWNVANIVKKVIPAAFMELGNGSINRSFQKTHESSQNLIFLNSEPPTPPVDNVIN